MWAAKNLSQTYYGSWETFNPRLLQHSDLLAMFSQLLTLLLQPATPANYLPLTTILPTPLFLRLSYPLIIATTTTLPLFLPVLPYLPKTNLPPLNFSLQFPAKPYPQNFPTPFNFPFIPNLPLLISFPKLTYPLTNKKAPELLTPVLSFLPTPLLFFFFFILSLENRPYII